MRIHVIADVKHIWISKFSQKKVFFSPFDNIEKCLTDQNQRVSNICQISNVIGYHLIITQTLKLSP